MKMKLTDSILSLKDMFWSMLEAAVPTFIADRVKLCK